MQVTTLALNPFLLPRTDLIMSIVQNYDEIVYTKGPLGLETERYIKYESDGQGGTRAVDVTPIPFEAFDTPGSRSRFGDGPDFGSSPRTKWWGGSDEYVEPSPRTKYWGGSGTFLEDFINSVLTKPRSPLTQIAPKGQRALESWLLEMYGPIRGVNPGEDQLRRDIMEQEIRERDNPLFRQAQVTPGAFMNTVRPSELPYVKTPYDRELERRLFERTVPTMPTEDLRLLDFGTV